MSDSELALSAAQSFPAPFLIERAGPSTRKSFSSFNGSDPEQEHPPGLLPRDPAVHDLLGASRSASRRYGAYYGRGLHRDASAPGRAAYGQAAHGRDPRFGRERTVWKEGNRPLGPRTSERAGLGRGTRARGFFTVPGLSPYSHSQSLWIGGFAQAH